MQTFFVILAGNFLGSKFGLISQVVYLSIGLIGLPIFANGGGPGYIFQPTFGYLLACPIAAYIAGFAGQITLDKFRDQNILTTKVFYKLLFINFVSTLAIFLIGVIYLYINVNILLGKQFSFNKAFWSGFIVFLPGDVVKVILASYIFIKLQKIIK